MAEVFISNVGEVCDEYTCHTCDSSDSVRRAIIIYSGCSAHMSSDWIFSRNFRSTTGIQVRCANGQLVEASGVGEVMLIWMKNFDISSGEGGL